MHSIILQATAAWIAAIVAIISTATTVIMQIVFRSKDQKAKRRQEIMEQRKDALLLALQVIDHVYSNTQWSGQPATNPHEWDITLARDAMNKMIIYCANPNKAVRAFSKAIGLHNPETQVPNTYGPADLDSFRSIVCEELEVNPTNYKDEDATWIGRLPGGTQNQEIVRAVKPANPIDDNSAQALPQRI